MKSSDSLDQLADVLSQFQGEVKDAPKNRHGYGYDYADLFQLLQVTRPLLNKYGLSVTQGLYSKGERLGVETVLMHKSGQWVSSRADFPVDRSMKKDGTFKMSVAQEAGGVISYIRRYAYAAILGLTQTDNDAAIGEVEEVKNLDPQRERIHHLFSLLPQLPEDERNKANAWYLSQGCTQKATEVLIERIEKKLEEKVDGQV